VIDTALPLCIREFTGACRHAPHHRAWIRRYPWL
jgi:hypothetical protein